MLHIKDGSSKIRFDNSFDVTKCLQQIQMPDLIDYLYLLLNQIQNIRMQLAEFDILYRLNEWFNLGNYLPTHIHIP